MGQLLTSFPGSCRVVALSRAEPQPEGAGLDLTPAFHVACYVTFLTPFFCLKWPWTPGLGNIIKTVLSWAAGQRATSQSYFEKSAAQPVQGCKVVTQGRNSLLHCLYLTLTLAAVWDQFNGRMGILGPEGPSEES